MTIVHLWPWAVPVDLREPEVWVVRPRRGSAARAAPAQWAEWAEAALWEVWEGQTNPGGWAEVEMAVTGERRENPSNNTLRAVVP